MPIYYIKFESKSKDYSGKVQIFFNVDSSNPVFLIIHENATLIIFAPRFINARFSRVNGKAP